MNRLPRRFLLIIETLQNIINEKITKESSNSLKSLLNTPSAFPNFLL